MSHRPARLPDPLAYRISPGPLNSGDRADCIIIRPKVAGRVALVGVGVICGIVGAGFSIAGLANLFDPGPATALLPLGVLLLVTAFGLRSIVMAPAGGRLTLLVCPQQLVFERTGGGADQVERPAVGVVIVDGYIRAGVLMFAIYGPERGFVGTWETGWTAKSPRLILRALDRHQYPWVTPGLTRIWR